MNLRDYFIFLMVMAGVTYLLRAVPFVLLKGKIKSFKEGMNEVKEEIEKPLEETAREVKNVAETKDTETKSNGE